MLTVRPKEVRYTAPTSIVTPVFHLAQIRKEVLRDVAGVVGCDPRGGEPSVDDFEVGPDTERIGKHEPVPGGGDDVGVCQREEAGEGSGRHFPRHRVDNHILERFYLRNRLRHLRAILEVGAEINGKQRTQDRARVRRHAALTVCVEAKPPMPDLRPGADVEQRPVDIRIGRISDDLVKELCRECVECGQLFLHLLRKPGPVTIRVDSILKGAKGEGAFQLRLLAADEHDRIHGLDRRDREDPSAHNKPVRHAEKTRIVLEGARRLLVCNPGPPHPHPACVQDRDRHSEPGNRFADRGIGELHRAVDVELLRSDLIHRKHSHHDNRHEQAHPRRDGTRFWQASGPFRSVDVETMREQHWSDRTGEQQILGFVVGSTLATHANLHGCVRYQWPKGSAVALEALRYAKEEIEVVVECLACTAGVDNDIVWLNHSCREIEYPGEIRSFAVTILESQ